MIRELTSAAYGLILLAGVLVQSVALAARDQVPTLGQLFAWAIQRRSTQIGLVLAWWWLGWHFVTAR